MDELVNKIHDRMNETTIRMNETKVALEAALTEFGRQQAEFKRECEAYKNEKTLVQKLAATATPIVHLNIGGEKMSTSRTTLTLVPGTLLSKMFSGNWENELVKDGDGNYFLDFDPVMFRYLINQIRPWTLDYNAARAFKPPPGNEEAFIDFVRLLKFDEELIPKQPTVAATVTICPIVNQANNESFSATGGQGVRLLENGRVCERTDPTNYSYALGTSSYSNGVHVIRLKHEAGYPIMCILSQNITPQGAPFYNSPTTHGWDIANWIYINGGCAQKQWSNPTVNDVFELTIDCDARVLKIKNERTQQQDQMQVNPAQAAVPWRLFIIFWTMNTRIRLL